MVIQVDLINRSELWNIQHLKDKYEWLLWLNCNELSKEIIDTDNVQNALIEIYLDL